MKQIPTRRLTLRAGMTAVVVLFAGALFLTLLPATKASDAKKTAAAVTFSKDVAPIFYKNCAGCHRPGEIAPMSLLTYNDARPWAKSIREKVANRDMPPC